MGRLQFQGDVDLILNFGRGRPIYVTCEVARMDDPQGSEETCAHVLDDH